MRNVAPITGRIVRARTRFRTIEGKVERVVSKKEAEKSTGDKLTRNGRYLFVVGVDYPVSRSRCKIIK